LCFIFAADDDDDDDVIAVVVIVVRYQFLQKFQMPSHSSTVLRLAIGPAMK